MIRRLAAATLCTMALLAFASAALANQTGSELTNPSQCSTLPGTALGGLQGACMRCVGRNHYHFHPDLPTRQRCHRENFAPRPPHARH